VAVFENRQPVTAAKLINKSSLVILLLSVIRRLEPKLISEQKAEHIFVAPLYCQTACCMFALRLPGFSVLHLNYVNLKTVAQAEQKASSLAGWLLCYWFCGLANVLALWRWLIWKLAIFCQRESCLRIL
jgi:hypothetical protein